MALLDGSTRDRRAVSGTHGMMLTMSFSSVYNWEPNADSIMAALSEFRSLMICEVRWLNVYCYIN